MKDFRPKSNSRDFKSNDNRGYNRDDKKKFDRPEGGNRSGSSASSGSGEPRRTDRAPSGERKEFNRGFRSDDKRDFKPGEKRDFKPSDRRDFKPGEKRDFKPGEKRDFKPSDRRDFKPGEKRDFKPTDRRDFKPGEKRDFKPSDRRDFKSGEKRDFNSGEKREFKSGDKREFGRGDKRDFKPSEKRDFRPGEKREFKRDDKREFNRDDKREFNKDGKRDFRNDFKSELRKEEEGLRLEGRNAVLEALNHGKPIDKILVKKGEVEGSIKVIVAKARERGIVVSEVSKDKLDEMAQTRNHQGVMAMCPAKEYCELSDILDKAKAKGEDPFVIVLDSITDTHNLGAIIRSADAAGAHGVVIPKHRAAGLTGIVSKTSAGALEHVLVAKVVNVTRAIEELKSKGIWVAVGDMEGQNLYQAPLEGPIALVIGGEGEGAGRLVKENCDFVVKIPMLGKISSLNASVAAGVLMYEVVRRRRFM